MWVHVPVRVCLCVNVGACACACVFVRECGCMCACASSVDGQPAKRVDNARTHSLTYMHTYTHTFTYIPYTQTHTHTHTHTGMKRELLTLNSACCSLLKAERLKNILSLILAVGASCMRACGMCTWMCGVWVSVCGCVGDLTGEREIERVCVPCLCV